jgi:1,4-alpha-glucan branching enzyme
MTTIGAFTFVLHSHLPYARRAGRWPHGEEWLHEAAAETYIPLLDRLYRLWDEDIPVRLTLTLTPVLLEQLADEAIQRNFRTYLQERIDAVQRDVERFEASNDTTFRDLSHFYHRWYQEILYSFEERYKGDLVSAFRQLQQGGMIEIATSAATHGYLPLLGQDESIELQLRTAVESYKRHFGRQPKSIWLPECAYRPGLMREDGRKRDGLESFLTKYDLHVFFSETHMVEQGTPVAADEGRANGPAGAFKSRLQFLNRFRKKEKATTFQPYHVGNSDVAVLARNRTTSLQVWSADWGYPGEVAYREFHKKDAQSGMRYWRVTGSGVDLGGKETYQLGRATERVQEHADHFCDLVLNEIQSYSKTSERYGIIAANFDTELFGHWWFEGVDWLEAVLRRLAASVDIQLTTASNYLEEYPPQTALNLPEGSWGAEGNHSVWDNKKTHWMWRIIHDAEVRMAEVVMLNPAATGVKRQFLDQAVRELLLLQSSDWPFLVTTGQASKYAARRFLQHVERFNELITQAKKEKPDKSIVEDCWERDNIFPEIDYKWFKT